MPSVLPGVAALSVASVLGGVGGRRLREGLARRRDRDDLRAAPVRSLADLSAPEGEAAERVRVTGTATPVIGTLQAPFSETEALVADWRVDERGYLPRFTRAGRGVDAVPFVVEDGTARALVWPTPGAVALEGPDTTVTVGRDERAPDPVRRFLSRPDAPDAAASVLPGIPVADGRARRYAESRLEPGDEVTVVGRPRPVSGGDHAREPEAAADGGRPTVSVADADVTVAFGPSWDEASDEPEPPVGLTQSGDDGPSLAAAPDASLVLTDRSPEALSAEYEGATRQITAGAALLVAALSLAGAGVWSLVG